jgi:diacylglycerol kinase (ATP)
MDLSARQRFLLIHNAIAGVEGRSLADDVVVALEKSGATVTRAAPGETEMRCLAATASDHFDAVIAAGGDGTVRALAAALGSQPIPIAFVPMGTGNVLASEVALPRKASELAQLIRSGPSVRIEGARVNGEPFFLMTGVGFDGAAVSALSTPLKRRVGKAAYTLPGLKAFSEPLPVLDIEIDGISHRASWIVVANGHRYGGPFIITRKADLRQRGLQAVLIKSSGKFAQLRQLTRLGLGMLDGDKDVEVISCQRVSVRSASGPVLVQCDGDPFGETPVLIEAGGPAFHLIVPEAYANGQ